MNAVFTSARHRACACVFEDNYSDINYFGSKQKVKAAGCTTLLHLRERLVMSGADPGSGQGVGPRIKGQPPSHQEEKCYCGTKL